MSSNSLQQHPLVHFPSIGHFSDVVETVRERAFYVGRDAGGKPIFDNTRPLPVLRFRGTVKMHGTNAGIIYRGDDSITYQSRENVLNDTRDNFGFREAMQKDTAKVARLIDSIVSACSVPLKPYTEIAVFGEWCGGDIERSVALAKLPKMFVIVGVRINGEWVPQKFFDWFELGHMKHVGMFPQWEIEIDFSKPQESEERLAEITHEIEQRCPVGYTLGVEGIGEGACWVCVDDPTSRYWFKVKGEKHAVTIRRVLAPAEVEVIAQITTFVQATVTEARCLQGFKRMQNELGLVPSMGNMGEFIRWVHGDILKEEATTIAVSGFDPKKLGAPISAAAKKWYFARLEQN